MRVSQLFTKTLRQAPKEEVSQNAQLLTRGGFMFKNKAGVYSLLPLGVRVMVRIEQIIREEMDKIDGQELHLNMLQDAEVWKKSGRWSEAKAVMYQWQDSEGKDQGLGFTHEEVVAQIASQYIQSYKDLPKFVYQIQTKFRNEPRPQAGILRGREFGMKDLYSLTADVKGLEEFYEKCAKAYERIFQRMGLKAVRTEASGGLFSPRSDEYQVVAEVGEDTILVCGECGRAVNKEIIEAAQHKCANCGSEELAEERAIEVGNIFKLGTKFSEALGLFFTDKDGTRKPVVMGSYGIGTGRLMGTVVEVSHDKAGIIWPESIAPFTVHLVGLSKKANQVAEELEQAGIQTLYDDRDGVSAGEKFADADLIGLPYRLVVSEKTGDKIELKRRSEEKTELVTVKEVIKHVTSPV